MRINRLWHVHVMNANIYEKVGRERNKQIKTQIKAKFTIYSEGRTKFKTRNNTKEK